MATEAIISWWALLETRYPLEIKTIHFERFIRFCCFLNKKNVTDFDDRKIIIFCRCYMELLVSDDNNGTQEY